MKSNEGFRSSAAENPSFRVSLTAGLKGDLEGRGGATEELDVQSALTEDETLSSPLKSLSSSFLTTASSDRSMASTDTAAAETPSVARTLARLLSITSNRKCADCRAHMVDSSQTFASFSPSLGKLPADSVIPQTRIEDFRYNHEAFAPDDPQTKRPVVEPVVDPALHVTQLLGGHGVFICKACARAHKHLGSAITVVKSVKDSSVWSLEQARFLKQCGGNSSSWSIYEGFVPEGWQRRKPSSSSSPDQRLMFCRAKYEALAFVAPSGGISGEGAWRSLLEQDKTLHQYLSPGCVLKSLSKLSLTESESIKDLNSSMSVENGMPDRFVDFFCVVGHTKKLYPGEDRKDLYAIESPEGLALESTILDCYPERSSHADMEFPDQISQFVFPDGCHASETQRPPAMFTFVLTSANGHRLYCSALRIYDETMETSQMKNVLEASGYTVPLPWWLSDDSAPPRSKDGKPARRPSDIVFLPKCLVVISHYSFFHAYRQFLKQLYQMSILETPLPIERYIANFTSELPLPPQGKVEVKFGFMSDVQCTISRPAPNELPLAKFSYRPLFTALSISNIIVVLGCLMEETRVALLSKRFGLLTPCTEALLSFLFPFEWQGVYIPVMPFSIVDILDAPVPFLVGLHSRYLAEVKPKDRPKGVVFVDLDRDVVHLGYCESEDGGRSFTKRLPPALPEKSAIKLRKQLQEFAACEYIVPANGIKGLITHGDGEYLNNAMREPYAHMETLDPATTSADARVRTLEESENAYPDSQGLKHAEGFYSEEGQLSTKAKGKAPDKADSKLKLFTKLRSKIDRKQSPDADNGRQAASTDLYNVDESIGNFNVSEIRNAFLRFFTSIFNSYDKYASNELSGKLFRSEDFLNEKNLPPLKLQWLNQVVQTQLFQRFLEERLEDPHGAGVLLFDEAIVAKNNRSKKKSIKKGKMTTPFLDDETWKISDSFTPPAPSNWGLPADGRRYSYSKFPRLDKSLFGTVRASKRWPPEWEQKIQRKGTSRVTTLKRREMFQTAIGPARRELLWASFKVPTQLTKIPKGPEERNLNWALTTLTLANLETTIEELDLSPCGTPVGHQNSIENSLRSSESKTPDEVRCAHEILLASRRKQGILILRVIKIQANSRKYNQRYKYLQYSPALKLATDTRHQRHIGDLSFVLKHILVIQSCVRWYIAAKRCRKRRLAMLLIQRKCKGILERRIIRKFRSGRLLQRWWRGELARRLAKKRRHLIVRVQSVYRGRRARFASTLVKNEIVKLQAQMRAYLARKHTSELLGRQVGRYRDQIFLLWKRARTPLSYRTQMWSLFKTSFLGSRIMVDELRRMWQILGIKAPANHGFPSDDEILCDLQNMGCCVAFERKFLKVGEIVFVAQYQHEDADTWFPGEESDRGHRYAKRLQVERLQVYERLDSLGKTPKLAKIYELFGIGTSEKKKKARALDKLWHLVEYASASAKAMMLLFPELKHGIDITQVKPSKKGLTRLKNEKNALLDPLDKNLWVDRKMDHLYRKNMSEVAIASIQTMPDLCVKLHDACMRKTSSFRRRKQARLISQHRWDSWHDYKRAVMQNYLYGEAVKNQYIM